MRNAAQKEKTREQKPGTKPGELPTSTVTTTTINKYIHRNHGNNSKSGYDGGRIRSPFAWQSHRPVLFGAFRSERSILLLARGSHRSPPDRYIKNSGPLEPRHC